MNIQAIYGRVTACARAVQNRWFLLAVFLAAFTLVKQRRFFHDDAFIELRYAYNLIHFGQLGWNPGEPIEGFTSVQHLLLVSWLGALNLPLPQAAHMVNFAAYAVALGAAWWALKLGSKGHGSAQAIGWLVMAASAPLVIWVWGGLEAVLACAWVSCAVALVIAGLRGLEGLAQRAAWALFTLAGLCFAMAVSARPDTLMLAVGCAAGLMLTCVRQTPLKAVMLAAAVLMPVALMQGALLYARWEVFHELVPNTYFAKVYGVPLSHRLLTGIRYLMLSMGELPMLPALAIVLALERQLWRERPVVIAACVLLCALASVWWVGGDHMASARFLVPILPVLAWLTASVVMLAPRQALSRTVLLGGMALTVMSPLLRYSLPVDAAAWAGRLVGEYMHQHWSPQSLVALNTAGAPAYFAPEMN
jgi:arabinofuranosyltransferase